MRRCIVGARSSSKVQGGLKVAAWEHESAADVSLLHLRSTSEHRGKKRYGA
jgi:hypothetical protein